MKAMADFTSILLRSVIALSLLLCTAPPQVSNAQPAPVPSFAFGWLDDRSAFRAGDTAVIMIKALDLPPAGKAKAGADEAFRRSLNFSATVNGKAGNSTFITDVAAHLGGEPASWNITFVPLRAGEFVVLVAEHRFGVGDSSLQFNVTAGDVHPSASVVSWPYGSRYTAGSKAFLAVKPKDAFGNDIARGTDMPTNDYFRVSGSYMNGSAVQFLDFQIYGWTKYGSISLEFVPTVAGEFLVQVYGDNRTLRGSPVSLTVKPGHINITKSTACWKHGTNFLQLFSKLEIYVQQEDSFGNSVPGIHPFDAAVVKRASNLSSPINDLLIEVVDEGLQLLSFKVVEPGEFVLTIFSKQLKQRVSDTVFTYVVFLGYCNGSNSFANGSGLAHSVAGSVSSFMAYLEDQFRVPCPVKTEMLQVQIQSKNGTSDVIPIITPLREPNDTISTEVQSFFYQEPVGNQKTIPANSTVRASHFNVSYTPENTGEYRIWIFCGNIVLNNGDPYAMTVTPGSVNTILSSVLMFDARVKRSVRNEVTVQLVDALMNPVVSLESKLRFVLLSASTETPMNKSSFVPGEFVDNKGGIYTAHYVASYLGSYNICIQFEDRPLPPCPLQVQVLEDEYFSEVQDDNISVWEDESISFDVLSNDYIAGGQAEVVNLTSPLHGSVLQYHQIHRYTPFEGFYGNDSFSYTISDNNSNIVNGTVFISVLCKPPQFISLPNQLHVTEDVLGPKYGGFPGIKIVYSDEEENISVTVKANSGDVLLAPMPMNLQNPSDYVLSISRKGRSGKDLTLQGTVEAINEALQFLQYIGNEDFYGSDDIMLYAKNRNGVQHAKLPIFVEPVNDPPVIRAPKSIFLGGKESTKGYQIFNKQRDQFELSIIEPDLLSYPGNKSDLLLVLSVEVLEGTLEMTLPASILETVEIKIEGNNHWQPLQSYVTILHHIIVRGTGIRFMGAVLDCNNAMRSLLYQGPGHHTTLLIIVNDLGNYGCYPDCSEMMSMPLSTTKTIRLVKRKHMNSTSNPLVEAVIAIEILTIVCLGGVLLYYILKCIKTVKAERRDRTDDGRRSVEQTPSPQRMSTSSLDDAEYYSAPAAVRSLRGSSSGFRQRSSRSRKHDFELQPISGIINDGNQDAQFILDKDK